MRVTIAAAFAALVLGGCSPSNDLPLGTASAAHFHQQLNAGQFAAIYAATSPAFKANTTEATLIPILSAVNRKLGKFKTSTVQGWNDNLNTNGHLLAITMASQYERGPATESFTFGISDGKASLYGYNVNSAALITN